MRKLACLFIIAVLFSCNKKEENEAFAPISPNPKIELIKVEPTVIQQFDDLVFYIRYTDGDGDIGTYDADQHSLEIVDTRDDILHTYHIPPQYVVKGVAITGVLQVNLENVILLDQSNDSEEVIFNIRLRDNKFNWSETVSSPVITIQK